MKVKHQELKCVDCEFSEIIEDYKNGYNVCSNCGCVIGPRIIDEGSEWRNFKDSGDPSRVGGPMNIMLDCEQLDTVISSSSLKKLQMKNSMRGPDRALVHGFNLIGLFCERGSLSKTINDHAKQIYKMVDTKKILRGKNTEGIAGACIYLACRQESCPRTFKEISLLTNVNKKEIGRYFKTIVRDLQEISITKYDTEDIIARFCADLSLNIRIQKMAVQISKNVREQSLITGRGPDSVAAGIIYLVTNLYNIKSVQKDIPIVTNVTEVTLKNIYKELLSFRHNVIPDEFSSIEIDALPNN